MQKESVQYRLSGRTLQVYREGEILSFDRSGRFKMLARPHETVRRGLDGRVVEVTDSGDTFHYRKYRDLDSSSRRAFLDNVYAGLNSAKYGALDSDLEEWLTRAKSWSLDALDQDRDRFRNIYLPVSILPPGEYQSIVVQLTEGCSYNQCLFCDFYRDRPFHIKNERELDDHLLKIRGFFGERLQDRSGIFLGDGNALVVPTRRLLHAMERTRTQLGPVADRFSTFMDTFNIKRKSQADLIELRNAGLDIVYVGLESGCDDMRTFLKKPGTAAEAAEAISYLKDAGLRVSPIVLAGVGDVLSQEHYERTAELLRQAPLDNRDLVFVSPFVEPDNHMYSKEAEDKGWTPFSEREAFVEALNWIRSLRRAVPAKVALYSILEHLY